MSRAPHQYWKIDADWAGSLKSEAVARVSWEYARLAIIKAREINGPFTARGKRRGKAKGKR